MKNQTQHYRMLRPEWLLRVNVVAIFLNICVYVISRDVLPQSEIYLPDYTVYHNYSSVTYQLTNLINNNPQFIKADWTYRSKQNRPQILLHVSNFTTTLPKLKLLFSYGEHAREFFPVETMFALLHTLVNGVMSPGNSYEHLSCRSVLSNFDLYIIVMANPDGRHYLEKSQNYCWRGTSTGVDLNRNFDWQFGNLGSSSNQEDEEYRGQNAFSEPESQIFQQVTSQHRFDAFFSFHSGIRQIYLPYADTRSKQLQLHPDNFHNMLDLAKQMSRATKYYFRYGEGYTLNDYTADGTIFDYMAGVRKIPYSYAVELWGEGDHQGARCFDLFNPRSEDLKAAVNDVLPLYWTIFQYFHSIHQSSSGHKGHFVNMPTAYPTLNPDILRLGHILLVGVIALTCYFAIHNYLPSYLRCFPRRRIISLRNLSSTFTSFSSLKTT